MIRFATLALLCSGLYATVPALAAGDRFIISPAGDEVTDTRSNLIWRRCSEGQVWTSTCEGQAVNLDWRARFDWARAVADATGLPWRLPNVKELQSLVDRSASQPAIDTTVFPATESVHVCTSTPDASNAGSAWLVNFDNGLTGIGNGYCRLRLVRDGS